MTFFPPSGIDGNPGTLPRPATDRNVKEGIPQPLGAERPNTGVSGPSVRAGKAPATPRYSRRLSDKILIAFHHACDQGDFTVAEQLLHILETGLIHQASPADPNRRRHIESLVAAHERLWHLRHPDTDPAWDYGSAS